MQKLVNSKAVIIALIASSSFIAQAEPFPLGASAHDTTPVADTAPFVLSEGLSQTLITDRDTLTAQGLPESFGKWDMSSFDPASKSIFIPSEVSSGAGVFRYDLKEGSFKVLMQGNGSDERNNAPSTFDAQNDEFSRIDPATLTPSGSLLIGEEATGGRLFEISNPKTRGKKVKVRWLSNIPAVGHEGLRFDNNGNMYFVDENNSGSVYKFTPHSQDDLSVGQSFVLSIDAFDGNAAANWDSTNNQNQMRTGMATWVAITDETGNALTSANPFEFVNTTGGRAVADELNGTPYGRPEDITMHTLANGKQVAYFTATSENTVYGIELLNDTYAKVSVFVNRDTVNLVTGEGVGEELTSPDNLATGADGTIYILEDQNPGDVWKAIDADNNGVAESVGRWISLGVAGSEPTGLEQDPNDPKRLIINVQHPDSGNDALWEIRID